MKERKRKERGRGKRKEMKERKRKEEGDEREEEEGGGYQWGREGGDGNIRQPGWRTCASQANRQNQEKFCLEN